MKTRIFLAVAGLVALGASVPAVAGTLADRPSLRSDSSTSTTIDDPSTSSTVATSSTSSTSSTSTTPTIDDMPGNCDEQGHADNCRCSGATTQPTYDHSYYDDDHRGTGGDDFDSGSDRYDDDDDDDDHRGRGGDPSDSGSDRDDDDDDDDNRRGRGNDD